MGRSKCENCHKTLTAIDLIPIVSYLLLRGKCRHCHAHLSTQYLLVEVLTGIMFVATYIFSIFNFQFSIFSGILNLNSLIINLVFNLVFFSCLIAIFFADLRYGIIPDKILIFMGFVSLVWFLFNPSLFVNHLIAGVLSFLFFMFIFLVTKTRGMGFGDVKLAFILGIFLGIPDIFLALYVSFLTGGLVGIILILWKKKGMKSSVAFGPFLVIGTFFAFFLASQIIPKVMDLLS